MALVKVGGGWSRKTKSTGEPFISLDVEGRKLFLYKNKHKAKENQPDYVIKEAKDDVPVAADDTLLDEDKPF